MMYSMTSNGWLVVGLFCIRQHSEILCGCSLLQLRNKPSCIAPRIHDHIKLQRYHWLYDYKAYPPKLQVSICEYVLYTYL